MNQHLRRFALPSALFFLAITSAACGKKGLGGLVTGARFQTAEENGELYGDLRLTLNTGGVQFPSFALPILNPSDPTRFFGAISMRDALGAGTELGIRVHLDEIPGLNAGDSALGSTLPNGKAIPVLLPESVRPVAFAIKDNSRAYLAFGESTAVVGAALVITEFDKLASAIGGADVFFPFAGENGIRGTAGLFSSQEPGRSGLAVFVDVGPALQALPRQSVGSMIARAASGSRVGFRTQKSLSSSQANRMNSMVRDLERRGRRLRLQ